MFLVDPSPEGFPLPTPALKDLLAGGAFARRFDCGATEVDLILISPFPPLSLPLSLAMLDFPLIVLLEALSRELSDSFIRGAPFSTFSRAPSMLYAGVFGWLISCTVSSVELAPLTPLAGVLMPVADNESSASLSCAPGFPSCCSVDCDVRCTLIAGTSCSDLRGERMEEGFWRGGGDRSLGDIGQRGVSLISGLAEGFWATGALIVVSEAAGCRVGIDAADNAR